jgi:hypothetical protein
VVAISHCEHILVNLNWTQNFWINSKSVEIWKTLQKQKVFQIRFPTSTNFPTVFLIYYLFFLREKEEFGFI